MARPPKTVEQHKLDGTYQKCRHADRGVSISKVLDLNIPLSLTHQKAIDAWNAIVPDLCKANLVTLIDQPELEHAFICYQLAQDTLDAIEDKGGIVKYYQTKGMQEKDLYSVYLDSMKTWQNILYKYGMTPVEAAKIRGMVNNDDNSSTKKTVEKLLSAKGKA